MAALEEALEKKESEMEKAIEGRATQRVEARMRLREEEMAGLGAEWVAERQVPPACHAFLAFLTFQTSLKFPMFLHSIVTVYIARGIFMLSSLGIIVIFLI